MSTSGLKNNLPKFRDKKIFLNFREKKISHWGIKTVIKKKVLLLMCIKKKRFAEETFFSQPWDPIQWCTTLLDRSWWGIVMERISRSLWYLILLNNQFYFNILIMVLIEYNRFIKFSKCKICLKTLKVHYFYYWFKLLDYKTYLKK